MGIHALLVEIHGNGLFGGFAGGTMTLNTFVLYISLRS